MDELAELHQRVAELENQDAIHRSTERMLRLTQFSIDSTSDAAFWMGPDARLFYVNDAASRSLGYSREELLQMTVHDIDPDFPQEIWQEHWQAVKQRGSFVIESHHRSKEGRIFPVEISINYLEFEGEEYNCAFARDITDRKQAEEELFQREAYLKAFFDNSAIGIAIADLQGRYIQVNQHYLEMFGYENEKELFLSTVGEVTHPDDRPSTREAQQRLARGEIEFFRAEKRYLRRDGSFFWGEVSVCPIHEPGGGIGAFVAIITDISERKRAEEELLKFKLGIERSNEAIFITDTEGTILYVNPAFEKTYGFSREEALGQTPRILKSGLLPQQVYEQFWKTLLSKQVVVGELINKTRDDRLLTMESSANPILDQDENIVGFLTIQRDITERKQAEQALQESEERLNILVEALPEGICLLDGERRLILANPAARKILPTLTETDVGEVLSHIGGRSLEEMLQSDEDGWIQNLSRLRRGL